MSATSVDQVREQGPGSTKARAAELHPRRAPLAAGGPVTARRGLPGGAAAQAGVRAGGGAGGRRPGALRGPDVPAAAPGPRVGCWRALAALLRGGGRPTGGVAAEELTGFTPTRIVRNNLSPIMSLINTLFFPLLPPPFTTSFVLLQRPKGQGNKGEFGYFILFYFTLRCCPGVIFKPPAASFLLLLFLNVKVRKTSIAAQTANI